MDRETRRRLEAWRAGAPDPQNAVVDDLFAGECDRAGFIRRASMFGLSVPAISAALVAAGEAPVAFAKETRGKAGGRIRVGLTPIPKGTLEPWTYQETVALQLGGMAGEFLNRNRPNLTLVPELAVSWTPNATGSQWTYKLRQGVKFANGKPMTADDVIATYKTLLTSADSQAGSAFSGVLSFPGIHKVDDLTIKFMLDTPTGNFPYLTSSTTYQAIILPRDYAGPFEKTPQTTGAFNLVAYTPGVSAKYERNPSWWGGTPPLQGIDCTLGDGTAIINALLGGQVDLIQGIVYGGGSRALFNNPNVQLFKARGATHREIPMRVDTDLNDSVIAAAQRTRAFHQTGPNGVRGRQRDARAVPRRCVTQALNLNDRIGMRCEIRLDRSGFLGFNSIERVGTCEFVEHFFRKVNGHENSSTP